MASCQKLGSNQIMTYADYVAEIEALYLSQGGAVPAPVPELTAALPFAPRRILIASPHPDDECLMAGAALRLREEAKAEVGVLPFSYGSNLSRREPRRRELFEALQVLGFELYDFREEGSLDELKEVEIGEALARTQPDLVIAPHREDAHPTHIRCSDALGRALRRHVNQRGAPVLLLESEYWHPLRDPNLKVVLSSATVARMGEALLRHAGEVARNPYHLTLPAWLMDQERRGSEILQGMGTQLAGRVVFSQLYRMSLISPGASS